MDIAGYCESCDRWFTCVITELDRFVCAWCGQEPLRIKGREVPRRAASAATRAPQASPER